ncbi:MAG: GAF domain-containing protein [Phycisphaera sp.]|nr:MAG: GAF domain-containing protein [Phycisphaera sp.]
MGIADPSSNPFEHLDQVHDRLFTMMNRQKTLAEFGWAALQSDDLDEVLGAAARLTAEGLKCKYAKVLEYDPKRRDFLVRAGYGWRDGVVGTMRVGADLESPAGYAFKLDDIVLSNDLVKEDKFRRPQILIDHGIHAAINVIIRTRTDRWGVLEADSPEPDKFDEGDAHFLHGFANLVGLALGRATVRSMS